MCGIPKIYKINKLIILIYYIIKRKLLKIGCFIVINGFYDGVFALFDVSSHSKTKRNHSDQKLR